MLNFVLPNVCLGCEGMLSNNESYLCSSCMLTLERYNETHPWQSQKISEGIVENSLSVYWFRENTPIQNIFHELKYRKIKRAGLMLGEHIGKMIQEQNFSSYDLIIPVPLHKAKLRDRTYNQSEFIALGIKNILNIPVIKDVLCRKRFTPSQTKLNKLERKENVNGAFEISEVKRNIVAGKNIILCDDVITTGATILECALTLKTAGAAKILVCSAAYAELKTNTL